MADIIYPTVQELANKAIRIENTGLQTTFMTMPTDVETGKLIGNITHISIDIDAKPGKPHITAKVTLYDHEESKRTGELFTREIVVHNPELLLDAQVDEIEMRWKPSTLFMNKPGEAT